MNSAVLSISKSEMSLQQVRTVGTVPGISLQRIIIYFKSMSNIFKAMSEKSGSFRGDTSGIALKNIFREATDD